ncbi:hypothetical protein B0O80DRAFT_447589 [Mortierella sp. GBAus27b]|nr:hypothetical protein B0O80DRAFT_447589 [Mortierella sp. GBAus27b]
MSHAFQPSHPDFNGDTPSAGHLGSEEDGPLHLTSVINRVREQKKLDPDFLEGPMPVEPPPVKVEASHKESKHHEHWYSFMKHYIRRHEGSGSSSSHEPPPEVHPVQPPPPVEPVKELTTLDHAANAFANTTLRSKNLETIDYTIESLGVSGAAAPVFLLMTDEKGRRAPPVLFQLVKVAIVDSEVDPEVGRQIIFRIELQYGDVKWVVRRTLAEFFKLHRAISNNPQVPRFPNQMSWAMSMAKAGLGMSTEDDKDVIVRESNLARRRALQGYLLEVMKALNGTVSYDLYEFLEISALSLTKDMGWKGKEGYLDIKVIDTSKTLCGIPIGFSDYDKCWAILRDSYIAFCPDISSTECKDVFIFDQHFYFKHKVHYLGLDLHHIELGNSHRKIELKGEHNRDMLEWKDFFTKMQVQSPWVKAHRYDSFAPERADAKVRYYVDGKDYFHAVSDAILAAKDEIYIADWWLSPELYLRRPPEKNEEFRLDRLLQKKAEEGVKIYIVVYKEVSLALTLDSAHTKTWLQNLHANIQVQRHPDHISVSATQFWAHHEKICVIDCRLAFIGGLDLCFGRYDSRTHQLADYHPSGSGTIWPGQDYSNPRIKDFANVKEFENDLISRKLLGRMPWHDVSIGVAGQPARDIARHFVQRWNFVKREKGMKKTGMKFLTPKGEFVSTRNESGWTGSQKVQILRSSTTWSQGVDLEHSIQNAYLANIDRAEHFIYIENQFFVTLAAEGGNPDLKNKIGIAIVNRIVRAHSEGKKFRVIVVMPLMPAFEADIMSSEAGTLRKVMHFQYVSISRGGNSILERLQAHGINPDQYIGFYGLRSFDRIKHGKFDALVEAVKEAEQERANATSQPVPQEPVDNTHPGPRQYVGHGQGVQVLSTAAEAPDNLTRRPHVESGSHLKVEQVGGEINRSKSLATRVLLDPIPCNEEAEHLKALSEKRKEHDRRRRWDESIAKRVMTRPRKELGYVPAATRRRLRGKDRHHDDDESEHGDARRIETEQIIEPQPAPQPAPVAESDNETLFNDYEVDDFITEQLYIHSKLMIVDDRVIIIGSANINDRSQVGFRDSEIAMIVEDTDMVASKMNGQDYQAGRIAFNLRTDLFKEHLGLLPHVEHNVVTQASLLPVDLDAPSVDPNQARKDLIAGVGKDAQRGLNAHGRSHGHLQVATPDEEEGRAFDQWQAKMAQSKAKQEASQDPTTADHIVMDPLSDEFYEQWWKPVAHQNTAIFREVFRCVPDENVETWDQYKAFVPDPKKVLTGHVAMPDATVEKVMDRLQDVTGHLVEFPTNFLCKENLLGNVVEGAVTPMEIFT